jgi:hypothetical protein
MRHFLPVRLTASLAGARNPEPLSGHVQTALSKHGGLLVGQDPGLLWVGSGPRGCHRVWSAKGQQRTRGRSLRANCVARLASSHLDGGGSAIFRHVSKPGHESVVGAQRLRVRKWALALLSTKFEVPKVARRHAGLLKSWTARAGRRRRPRGCTGSVRPSELALQQMPWTAPGTFEKRISFRILLARQEVSWERRPYRPVNDPSETGRTQ